MSLSSPPPLFQPLTGRRLQAEEGREGKKQLSLFPSPARGVKSSCNFDKAGIFALYMEMVHSHYYSETVSSKHILGEKKEESLNFQSTCQNNHTYQIFCKSWLFIRPVALLYFRKQKKCAAFLPCSCDFSVPFVISKSLLLSSGFCPVVPRLNYFILPKSWVILNLTLCLVLICLSPRGCLGSLLLWVPHTWPAKLLGHHIPMSDPCHCPGVREESNYLTLTRGLFFQRTTPG